MSIPLYIKHQLLNNKKTPRQVKVDIPTSTQFKDILLKFYSDDYLLQYGDFFSPMTNIVIDFTVGDIYLPIYTFNISPITNVSNITKEDMNYLYNKCGSLISIHNITKHNRYIVKDWKLDKEPIVLYNCSLNTFYTFTISELHLDDSYITSDYLIQSLMTRDLAKTMRTSHKGKHTLLTKKFFEIQSKLSDNVISSRLHEKKHVVPPVESHVLRQYNNVDMPKHYAEMLFNLSMFTAIYNNTDLLLHDGTTLSSQLQTNKFFFKIKNDEYYIILRRDWYLTKHHYSLNEI